MKDNWRLKLFQPFESFSSTLAFIIPVPKIICIEEFKTIKKGKESSSFNYLTGSKWRKLITQK